MKIFTKLLVFWFVLFATAFLWHHQPQTASLQPPMEPLTVEEKILCGLPLSLRQLDEKTWQTLPGIGPGLAKKLKGVRSLEELDAIPGIGPKRLEQLRPYFVTEF